SGLIRAVLLDIDKVNHLGGPIRHLRRKGISDPACRLSRHGASVQVVKEQRMRFLMGTGLLAFLILSGRSTQAALIQYEFSGEVYAVAEMGGLVEVGAPYTATWVFNANAIDSIPATYRG